MTVFATLRGMNNLFMFLLNILQVDLSGEILHNSKKKIAALLVAFVAFLMVATAFAGGLASPAVANPSPAQAASNSSSASGKMNLLTDLGNGNTLLMGSVGVNLPNVINPLYTHGPAVILGPIHASSTDVAVGQPVILSVQASSGLPPYSYTWSFGNGQSATGNAATVTYSLAGTYTVIASVTDQAGNTASSTINISVHPALSISVSPSSTTILGGQEVNFMWSISGGVTNQYGNYPSLLINWGDHNGADSVLLRNVSATGSYSHQYEQNITGFPGVYTAVFTVTDNISEVASATSQVTVNQLPYSLSIADNASNPHKLLANQPYTFYFNVTGGSGYNNLSVYWGDGSHVTYPLLKTDNFVIQHTYNSPGNYIILASSNSSAFNEAGTMFNLTVSTNKLSSSLLLFAHPNATTWTALPSTYSENVSTAISTPIAINATVAGGFAGYSYKLISASGSVVASSSFSGAVLYPGQTVYTFKSTTPGTYIYTLKVTDSTGNIVYSNDVSIIITGQALMPVVQPSALQGFAPLKEHLKLSLYNVQFDASGVAAGYWSLNLGSGAGTKTGTFKFTGKAGSFANEVDFASVSFTYKVPGAYNAQLSANYTGNTTMAMSSVVTITVNAAQPLTIVSFGSIPSPAIGRAPFAVQFWVNVTGELGSYHLSISTGDYRNAYLLTTSLNANTTMLFGNIYAPTLANVNSTGATIYYLNSTGVPYFNFTYTIVYPNPSNPSFVFEQTVSSKTSSGTAVSAPVPDITVVVKPAQPLFVQLFASRTKIEAGMSVAFNATISGGSAPYEYTFYPELYSPQFTGTISTPMSNQPFYFANNTLSASAQNNTWTYSSPGIYTAQLFVNSRNAYLPDMFYLVTIDVVPAVSASIHYVPHHGVAPVDVAFLGGVSGGQSPYSFTWFIDGQQVSTSQSFVEQFGAPGSYLVNLSVEDSFRFFGNVSTTVHISASQNVYQVVSARIQATLSANPSGPTYIAYAGPAVWDLAGDLNASFLMPNVPAVNAQYTLNVTYGYTIAVTQFHSEHLYGDWGSSIGVWETYFYDVYSPAPISQTLTVVAGGQILSESQLQAGVSTLSAQINGVNTNLSVDTGSLMSALQSGFKTVNNGIVTIQTQGSQIEASLSAINASIKSVGAGVSGLSGSLSADTATLSTSIGTIQTSLSNLNATVTSVSSTIGAVKGAQVTLSTDVGTLSGDITNVSNGVATIQTTAGQIKVATSSIQGTANSIKSSMSTMELLDIVIIVLVLITLAVALFSVSRSNALAKKLNGKGKNGGSGGMPPAGGSTMLVAVQPVRKNYRKLK